MHPVSDYNLEGKKPVNAAVNAHRMYFIRNATGWARAHLEVVGSHPGINAI